MLSGFQFLRGIGLLVVLCTWAAASGCEWVDKVRQQTATPSPTPIKLSGPRMVVTDRDKGFFTLLPDNLAATPELFPLAGGASDVAFDARKALIYATSPATGHLAAFYANGELAGRLQVGKNPSGVAISRDGEIGYVCNQDSNDISVLDLKGRHELRRIPCAPQPFDVILHPSGSRLYVTLHESGEVAAIDTGSLREIGRFKVGFAPYRMAFDPAGEFLYVAVFDNDEVVVLTPALKGVARLKTDDGPYAVAASQAGRIFATNMQSGSVSVFIRGQWKVDGVTYSVGARPYGLALTPNEAHLYVALEGDNAVTLRLPSDLSEIATITLPTAPTDVVAVEPAAAAQK
ncbi:MAG: YncE family protein [Armatimonadetes bacterium]|nr:YncE family protein [Armatimonadota bacterium]